MWRLAFFGILVWASTAIAEENPPKEGTYYTLGQVGIKKTEINGNQIKLVFKPKDEQFYWCPGIRIRTTKKARIVTFVRCKTSRTCRIDTKAAIGERLKRTISIDSNGLDVYVRNGPKKFKRIYKSPNSSVKSKSKEQGAAKSKSTKSGSPKRSSMLLRPAAEYSHKRHVTNYLIKPSVD